MLGKIVDDVHSGKESCMKGILLQNGLSLCHSAAAEVFDSCTVMCVCAECTEVT